MSERESACVRLGHAWHVRQYGGISCGRQGCTETRSQFCMIHGRPVPQDEHPHDAVTITGADN